MPSSNRIPRDIMDVIIIIIIIIIIILIIISTPSTASYPAPTFSSHWPSKQGHLALPGGGTDRRGRKTDGQHHRWREGDHLPVPAAVIALQTEGKCGLIPKHVHYQLACCNSLFSSLFLMSSCLLGLSQQAIIIIIIIIYVFLYRQSAMVVTPVYYTLCSEKNTHLHFQL